MTLVASTGEICNRLLKEKDIAPRDGAFFISCIILMQERKPYPTILQAVGIVFIIILFMLVAGIATPTKDVDRETKNLLLLVRKIAAMGGAFFVIHNIRKNFSGDAGYNFRPQSVWILLAAIVSWVLLYVLMTIFIYLDPGLEQSGYFTQDHSSDSLYIILRTALIAPVFEELIFRGIILDGFLKRYGPTIAIISSAIMFGFMHMNVVQALGAMFMGVLLGWFYWQTRSLFICIFIHALNNFLVVYPFDRGEDKELLRDILTPLQYYSFYAVSVLLFAGCIYFISRQAKKRRRKDNSRSLEYATEAE